MISDYVRKDKESQIIIILPEEESIMSFNGSFEIKDVIVASSNGEVNVEMPNKIILSEAYPNPFNPTTNIDFYLSINNHTTIKAYNVWDKLWM